MLWEIMAEGLATGQPMRRMRRMRRMGEVRRMRRMTRLSRIYVQPKFLHPS